MKIVLFLIGIIFLVHGMYQCSPVLGLTAITILSIYALKDSLR